MVLYDEPLLQQIIPVSGLVLIFAGLSSVPAATLERELRFGPLTARHLAGAIVGAAVAVVLAMLGFGVWALVAQPVVAAVVATLVLWISARWVPRFRFSWESFRSRWAFSLQIVLIEFLNAMQSNIDKFLIGIFFGPTELGFYFIGERVLTILMEVVAAVVGKVSLPILSRVQSDHQRFLQYFYTLTFASAGIAFAAFGVTVAFGYPLTEFLFGPGWTIPCRSWRCSLRPQCWHQSRSLTAAPCSRRGKVVYRLGLPPDNLSWAQSSCWPRYRSASSLWLPVVASGNSCIGPSLLLR